MRFSSMKYNKYFYYFVGFSLLILFLFILYQQKVSYNELTNDSIEELRIKENIEILDYEIINNVKEPFAIVFYKKGYRIGSYSLKIINNKLVSNMEFLINEDINQSIQTFGRSSGYPYQLIRINDERFLEIGNYILFSFGNENKYRVTIKDNRKNYIIIGSYKESENQTAYLEVLDKNHEIIYKEW